MKFCYINWGGRPGWWRRLGRVDGADAVHLGWRSTSAGLEEGVKAEENTIPIHHCSVVLTGK